MDIFKIATGKPFKLDRFIKSFKLTWLYVSIGLIFFLVLTLSAGAMPKKSFFFYFIQNIGMFILFSMVLMAYSGVYRITTAPDDREKITREALKSTGKRAHYIFGLSLGIVAIFTLIVLIEVGLSSISMIPYAGPVLISLFTIPIFIINFFCILIAIAIFAVAPPIISEIKSPKDIFLEVKINIKERWLNVVIYVVVSLSILVLSLIMIYFIVEYTIGITKAVQWKVNAAYPKFMKTLIVPSYFSDLIYRITPRPDSIAAIKQYGKNLVKYLEILRYIIVFSYIILFSFIISFPFAIYFNLSSRFFGRVNIKEQK